MQSMQPALNNSIQSQLGQHLQTEYQDFYAAPLPARLTELILRLEEVLLHQDASAALAFRSGLLEVIPNLRAFAISLTHNVDRADDLVQDTILRAWNKRDSFQPGTNLPAWAFTIMRNGFYTEHRKRRLEVEDPDGTCAATLTTTPDQMSHLEMQDVQAALKGLRPDQRKALLLVAVEGLSYEDAAAVCGVAVGTVKSRVNRARIQLALLMSHTDADFSADPILASALNPSR
jgi:RNA polymerase sigma-70 factor, ECF subfamily